MMADPWLIAMSMKPTITAVINARLAVAG